MKESKPFLTNMAVFCYICSDLIYSRYSGHWVSCRCGACFIDQTMYYSRIGGYPDKMEQIPIEIKNPDLHIKLRQEYYLEEYQKASQALEKEIKRDEENIN